RLLGARSRCSPRTGPPGARSDLRAPAVTLGGVSLRSLPPLLRHEPAMVDALSVGSTALAVPEAATAFVIAGVARLSDRRPMLVVTPTVRDAERVAHDLSSFLGAGTVALFPAWDTLPFERVSPEVATMGERLRLLWHLGVTGDGD